MWSNRKGRRSGVALGVLLAGSLVASVLAVTAMAARNTDSACPPGQVPEDGFTDVRESFAESAIDCLVAYGITKGQTRTTYGTGTVTRGQMTSFAMRTLDRVTGYERPANAPDAFPDDDDDVHEANIDDAAEEGIARGYGDGTFRPGIEVSRAEMASLVVRTLDAGGASLPANAPDAFDDDEGNTHEANINILADLEVVEGRADGSYGPLANVTREQIALFLTRGLDVLVDQQLVVPPFGPQAAGASEDAPAGRVAMLDKAANEFGLDVGVIGVGDYSAADADMIFTYDASDTFTIGGTAATMQEFEDALSRGDAVDPGAYSPEANDTSVFDITGDGPNAPSTVVAENAGGGSDDIVVTIDPSAPDLVANYDAFTIQRAPVSNGNDESSLGIVGDYAVVATVPVSADEDSVAATFTWTDRDVPAGSYRYRAAGVIDGDTGALTADPNNETSVAQARLGGPRSDNFVMLVSDSSTNGADEDDIWRLAFDEPLAELEDGDSITLTETGTGSAPEQTTVTKGDNAKFLLSPASLTINGVSYGPDQVLTIVLDARLRPSSTVSGGDTLILYPLAISSTSGLTDAQGEVIEVVPSADKTVEADDVAPQSDSLDVDDKDRDGRVSHNDVITVTFSEHMGTAPTPFQRQITITDFRRDAVTLEDGVNGTTFSVVNTDDNGVKKGVITVAVGSIFTTVDYQKKKDTSEPTKVSGARYVTDVAGHGWDLVKDLDTNLLSVSAPISISATQTDGGNAGAAGTGILNEGDVLTIVFDKPMSVATTGDRIKVRHDPDGDDKGPEAELVCTLNVACEFENPTKMVMTVNERYVAQTPVPVGYEAVDSLRVRDESDNEWNIGHEDEDVTFD